MKLNAQALFQLTRALSFHPSSQHCQPAQQWQRLHDWQLTDMSSNWKVYTVDKVDAMLLNVSMVQDGTWEVDIGDSIDTYTACMHVSKIIT